jgi:hypothetical protein
LKVALDDLDRRMVGVVASQAPSKRIQHGFDYIIAAEIDPAFKAGAEKPAQGAAAAVEGGEL